MWLSIDYLLSVLEALGSIPSSVGWDFGGGKGQTGKLRIHTVKHGTQI